MSAFKITGSKGFHMTFPNGYTISIQFGGGNYSTNYDMKIGSESKHDVLFADTVETAFWGPNGTLINEGSGDIVQAYQTVEQVWERMKRIAGLKRENDGE